MSFFSPGLSETHDHDSAITEEKGELIILGANTIFIEIGDHEITMIEKGCFRGHSPCTMLVIGSCVLYMTSCVPLFKRSCLGGQKPGCAHSERQLSDGDSG